MRYVDGFVLPVPKKNVKTYRAMASKAGKMWKKHGALEYIEAVGDDLTPSSDEWTFAHFPKTVRMKKNETVVFALIIFKSRKHRDQVNAKVMKDPLMHDPAYKDMPMPFDMKRMVYGGFKILVDL